MKLRHITLALAVAIGLAACAGDPTKQSPAGDAEAITIGSAAFPENEIIAEIYAQALESKGIAVRKQLNIGAREVYIPALKNGEIDLIPEYTGNLLTYLDPKATASAPDEVLSALVKAVPADLGVLSPRPPRTRTRSM